MGSTPPPKTPPTPPPPPNPLRWAVDYFQINGSDDSVGECAIVLLVDKDVANTKGTKKGGKIKKTVLVDAGLAEFAIENLKKTMTEIKANYSAFENFAKGCLQFDSVVLSHWDQDHYYGFSKHTKAIIKDPEVGKSGDQIQCFKYDTNGNPLTILYCQWWNSTETGKVKTPMKMRPDPTITKNKGKDTPKQKDKFIIDWAEGKEGHEESTTPKGILLGSARVDCLLGLEIFSGRPRADDPGINVVTRNPAPNTIKTVDELLVANPSTIGYAPGLYIVGTNFQCLGDEPPETFQSVAPVVKNEQLQSTASTENEEQAPPGDTPDDQSEQPLVGIVNENVKTAGDNNANSIQLMLIWPNPQNPKEVECTLYSGGDAEWKTERKLNYWLKQSNKTVKCLKVGHHGSRAGTSTQTLSVMRPQHILISAGYQHGHPTHELIYYLGAWFESAEGSPTDDLKTMKRIHAGCYPYWLLKVKDVNARLIASKIPDPDTFISTAPVDKAFVDSLKKLLEGKLVETAAFDMLIAKLQLYVPTGDVDTANNILKQRDSELKTAKANRRTDPTAYKTADANQRTAKDDVSVAKHKEQSLKFSTIWTVYPPIWEKWSKTGYRFCPEKGQTPADLIRYLQIGLKYGEPPQFKIVATDNTEFYYPDVVITQVPKSAKTDTGAAQQVLMVGTQTQSRKRKTTESPTEEIRKLNDYYLSLQDEAKILAIEKRDGGIDDGEDDGTGTSDMDLGESLAPSVGAAAKPSPTSITTLRPPDDPGVDADTLIVNDAIFSHFLFYILDGYVELSEATDLTIYDTTPRNLILKDDDGLNRWYASILGQSPSPFRNVVTGLLLQNDKTDGPLLKGFRVQCTLHNSGLVNYNSNAQSLIQHFGLDQAVLSTLLDERGNWKSTTGNVLAIETGGDLSQLSLTLQELFGIVGVRMPSLISVAGASVLHLDVAQTNAIWYYPANNHQLIFRIGAVESASTGLATTFNTLFSSLAITFDPFTFIGSKSSRYMIDSSGTEQNVAEGSGSLHTGIHLSGGPKWDAYVTIDDDLLGLVMRWNNTTSALDDLWPWLRQRTGISQDYFDSQLSLLNKTKTIQTDNSTNSWHFREVAIQFAKTDNGWEFQSFKIRFELDLAFGIQPNQPSPQPDHIPFLISLSYVAPTSDPVVAFEGQLWPEMTVDSVKLQRLDSEGPLVPALLPLALVPLDRQTATSQFFISLPNLLNSSHTNSSTSWPTFIPQDVTAASIILSNLYVAFSCTVANHESTVATGTTDDGVVPFLRLDKVIANAKYTFGTPSVLDLSFSAFVVLSPRLSASTLPSAFLTVQVDYSSAGNWQLKGNMNDVNFATLYSLFPAGDNEAVMNALEKIYISEFDIEYDYDPAGSGKSFSVGGSLFLGPVRLDLSYRCNTSGVNNDWAFDAHLSPDTSIDLVTLGDILQGISPDIRNDIPDFISSLELSLTPNDFLDLEVDKKMIGPIKYITTSFIAKFGNFEFSFVQVTDSLTAEPTKKRVLRVTLDRLPPITAVPLLQRLEQPFDQMDFLWASEDLTRQDVMTLINPHFLNNKVAPILFRDPRGTTTDPNVIFQQDSSWDIVITRGCHFTIVVEESNVPTVVLDHAFDGGQTEPPATNPTPTNNDPLNEPDPPPPTVGNTSASSGVLAKKAGPLSITGIGLKYHAADPEHFTPASFSISFSASVAIGPISGELKNFSVNFPITSIRTFDPAQIHVSIDGIGLGLKSPPVAIAGLLNHKEDVYSGGLSIQVEPYTFLAGGSYGVPKSKIQSTDLVDMGNPDYRSLFVFAEVDGPLVELEFASLSGIVSGFGYNNDIRIPTVQNVTTFPFLASNNESDPLKILDGYLNAPDPWFTAEKGPIWLSAGLTAKAFQTLDIKAALMLDILPDDVIFGLFADAQAAYPADAAPNDRFALVDMGLIALVDFAKGIVKIEGQLTPKSFILDPNCKLSGGFALAYFFEGSGHDGDWVFTIGGFHPQFQVPQWYPNPPRVAITWKYDSTISIYGDAYLAVTPKSCMGGGSLKISYHSGDLSAGLDAYADFLINYKPFHFIVDAGVSVDIVYHQDLLVTTKDWHIHFGANVHLWGPPIAGIVHVDWCIISFDISFGNSNPKTDPIQWSEFTGMLSQIHTDDKPTADDTALITVKPTAGVVADPAQASVETTSTQTIMVDISTFSFDIVTLVPSHLIVHNKKSSFTFAADKPSFKPMQTRQIDSTQINVDVTLNGTPVDFSPSVIMKDVPRALWDPYPTSIADQQKEAAGMWKATDGTRNLMMGLSLQTPPPDQGKDPELLVDIHAACMEDVLRGAHPSFNHSVVSDQEAAALSVWLPQSGANAVLPLPQSPPVAADWDNLKLSWTSSTRPIHNLVSTWATLSGAKEGDDLFQQYIDYGSTSSPPANLLKVPTTYLPAIPLVTPKADYTISPTFDVVSVAFGSADRTKEFRNVLIRNPDPPLLQYTLDPVAHTFRWWPDYRSLQPDPNPYHNKPFIMVYRPIVSYPSYGASADPIYGYPRTLRTTEVTEINFNWADGLSFREPSLDSNGRAILSATFWDQDVTSNLAANSVAQKVVTIDVERNMYTFDVPVSPVKVALTVTWATKKYGVWEWHMAVQEVGATLIIPDPAA